MLAIYNFNSYNFLSTIHGETYDNLRIQDFVYCVVMEKRIIPFSMKVQKGDSVLCLNICNKNQAYH